LFNAFTCGDAFGTLVFEVFQNGCARYFRVKLLRSCFCDYQTKREKLRLLYTRRKLQFALKDITVTLLVVLHWCEKFVALAKEYELGASRNRVLGKIFDLQGGNGGRLEKSE